MDGPLVPRWGLTGFFVLYTGRVRSFAGFNVVGRRLRNRPRPFTHATMPSLQLINELLRNASPGDTVRLPAGVYMLDAGHEFPAALANLWIDARGVTFIETLPIVGPSLVAASWSGVHWLGGALRGVDTEGQMLKRIEAAAGVLDANGKAKELASEAYGLGWRFDNPIDVTIEAMRIESKDRGVMATKGARMVVKDLRYAGHYSGVSKFNEAGQLRPEIKDLARLCYAVTFLGGEHHEVRGGWVENAGGAVVVGSSLDGQGYGLPRYCLIDGIRGQIIGDNGVYVSSAESCEIRGAVFTRVTSGHAAKMRGSLNRIYRSKAIDCHAGFLLEGIGKDVDELGANAFGSACERCEVVRSTDLGLSIDDNQGNFPRDFRFIDNIISESLWKPEFRPPSLKERAAFQLDGGQGIVVEGNIVDHCAGDTWLILGNGTAKVDGSRLGRNTIRRMSQDVKVNGKLVAMTGGLQL